MAHSLRLSFLAGLCAAGVLAYVALDGDSVSAEPARSAEDASDMSADAVRAVFPTANLSRAPVVDSRGIVVGSEARLALKHGDYGFGVDSPFTSTDPTGDDVKDVFPAAETGWKAAMVAATIAERDRSVLAYRVAAPVSVSAGAENYLHGVLRTWSDAPIGAD